MVGYDDIIVGGGSAGIALASRLSENPARQVLLIAAGPDSRILRAQIYDMVQRPDLKFPPYHSRQLQDMETIFERAAAGDVLLHHPFDAFTPVLELIKQAAEDPNVLAIKQTLYRAGKDSPIV